MLQVEQVLQNRYQLQRQLGSNGVRQTWLASDLQALDVEKKQVVVKCLAFSETVQWDDLKLFQREAQVLKNLHHPQIPKYIDDFCIGDAAKQPLRERTLWFCLVQEYIPGESLKELLVLGKRFTEIQAKEIAVQVLDILTELHELYPAVLHRDIKPSNLIWGETGKIYLVDFGAVQDRTSREGATFTVVGTYGYAPMEQFGGRAVPASDLYALGMSLIHLVTGISPSDLPQSNLKIQFSDAAKQPLRERVSLSPSFTSWLQKMTEPAPENRFSTARQAMDALNSGLIVQDQDLSIQDIRNNSGCGLKNRVEKVPEEIKSWNWGAFLVPWFWLWQNHVWSGLLCFVPIVGFLMSITLGIKGNEWAWKSRRWRSIQHFKEHQRSWAIAGILFAAPISILLWLTSTILLVSVFLP
ncbi:serine/threonine protein kinase [Scytonema hofmannii PCC 7110]|uniref:Serine/threonine protein kinase n=1 Tax=Scytonema hofmannii PCC 7110 TaxID=128403 RepID=A0A139X8I0_9CYAN|nr:serine/threonine-protein kinase [Scytonema hofmannii]KYC40933.1 serine/threonine protein kinase [Scytonema hofmannii PCC 7110]